MKRIFLLISVLLFTQHGQAESQTIRCENIGNYMWYGYSGTIRACYMDYRTRIDTEAVSVSPPDSKVDRLHFRENKKISFLPIKLDETFPNLVTYDAGRCSLKRVSKINFKSLKQLKSLLLRDNQIERINSDTFEDLTSLDWLDLAGNKIKQINGAAFGKLNTLDYVALSGNICIDKHYSNGTTIANTLVNDVNENCAFAELDANEGSTMKTLAHWNLIFIVIFMTLLA